MPVDLRRLREAGRQTHDIQMLVPQQLASRGFDVTDPGTPRGALEMDDGAKERIHTSGDCVDVDRIEQHERRARVAGAG